LLFKFTPDKRKISGSGGAVFFYFLLKILQLK
jgi:hypothetical protein